MIFLKGEERGEFFAREGVGVVHTVYGVALNILLSGHYYSLLKDESLLSPFSLIAKELFELDFNWQNRMVYFQHNRVEIEGIISIEVPKKFVRLSVVRSELIEMASNRGLLSFLQKFGKPEGMQGVVDANVSSVWSDKALRLLSDEDVISSKQLVGLGIGLTPSGDDFLCGVLLGLDLQGREIEFEKLANSLDLQRTGFAGRTLLAGAIQRRYPLPFRQFAIDWVNGKLNKNIFDFGSTSGTDFVCGLCWVLMKTNQRKER